MTTNIPSMTKPLNSTVSWDDLEKIQLDTTRIPFVNTSKKSIKELYYNGTGYYIEEESEPGLNDLQTLFLACFATLIPLIISVVAAFGIRILWVKYRRRREEDKYDSIVDRERMKDSSNKSLHSHLLNNDKISGDTHLDISADEVEICESTYLNSNQIRSNHSSTNGSIITMTLKNNHLIVETEERNDIDEDCKETTMKYSPGARDGVFVVEVQQGVRRSPSAGGSTTGNDKAEHCMAVSDQCALIHNTAERCVDEKILEESNEYVETSSPTLKSPVTDGSPIKTGLSQSNSSLYNQSYSYTSQQCYDHGQYGYTNYNGYINNEPLQRLANNNKPKITSAVYKNPAKSMDLDEPTDGFLLSDVTASQVQTADDEVQKEQIRLGNTIELAQKDILSRANSTMETETDVGSAEYENRGFDCNNTTNR